MFVEFFRIIRSFMESCPGCSVDMETLAIRIRAVFGYSIPMSGPSLEQGLWYLSRSVLREVTIVRCYDTFSTKDICLPLTYLWSSPKLFIWYFFVSFNLSTSLTVFSTQECFTFYTESLLLQVDMYRSFYSIFNLSKYRILTLLEWPWLQKVLHTSHGEVLE